MSPAPEDVDGSNDIDRRLPLGGLPQEAAGAERATHRLSSGIPPLLLALLTFLVFCPVLKFQFVPFWDDNDKVLENPDYHPAHLSTLLHYWVPPPHQTFYVPLTYTVYGLLAMAAGFTPLVFHATNLFCHIVSAVMVYLILMRLLGRTRAAWLGAALFAIHPVQVDPVAWIGTLYTPLSSMFGLMAIWMYLRFAGPGPVGQSLQIRSRHWGSYTIATLALLLALLAKPSTVVVPVMVAAIEIGLYRRRIRDLFFPLGLWGALCVPIVVINRLAYPGTTIYTPPPWGRLIVSLDTIAFYLWKLAWPFHMIPDYGRSPRWVVNNPQVWLTCLVPIALFVVCRVLWRRIPWIGVATAVFVAGLIPVLGWTPFDFQIYSTPADRYVSLSMLGVALAVAFVLARFRSKVLTAVVVLLLCALAVRSVNQTSIWPDQWRLFASTLETNPQSKAAQAAFRYLLVDRRDLLNQCTLSPGELVEIGDLLLWQHHSDLATDAYNLSLSRGGPDANTYRKLAGALLQNGDQKGAEEADKRASDISQPKK